MENKKNKLVEILLEADKISKDDADKVIHIQKETHESIDRILLNLGIISEEDLRDALGHLFKLPIWQKQKGEKYPIIDCLPKNFLYSNRILPLKQDNGCIDIALTDPSDESLIEVIESTIKKRVNILIGCEKDIVTSIDEVCNEIDKEAKVLEPAYELGLDFADDIEKLKDLALEAPVIRLVNNILNKALEIKASDIHIEMFENQPRLRYRLDGVLRDYPPPQRDLYLAVISRIKIISNLNIT